VKLNAEALAAAGGSGRSIRGPPDGSPPTRSASSRAEPCKTAQGKEKMKRLTPRPVGDIPEDDSRALPVAGAARAPWRKTRNAYRILVSECMLQQTQVARVLEKYGRSSAAFPISNRSRARRSGMCSAPGAGSATTAARCHLRETARAVVERHGGALPRDLESLLALPGWAARRPARWRRSPSARRTSSSNEHPRGVSPLLLPERRA